VRQCEVLNSEFGELLRLGENLGCQRGQGVQRQMNRAVDRLGFIIGTGIHDALSNSANNLAVRRVKLVLQAAGVERALR